MQSHQLTTLVMLWGDMVGQCVVILNSGYSLCRVSVHVFPVPMWVSSRLSGYIQPPQILGELAILNFPRVKMNECMCVCHAMAWGPTRGVFLEHCVLEVDSASTTTTLTRIKWLLMNE